MVETGTLEVPGRALWWQVVGLALSGVVPRLRGRLAGLFARAYGLWFWAVLALVTPPVLAVVWALPVRRLRRRPPRRRPPAGADDRHRGPGVRPRSARSRADGPSGHSGVERRSVGVRRQPRQLPGRPGARRRPAARRGLRGQERAPASAPDPSRLAASRLCFRRAVRSVEGGGGVDRGGPGAGARRPPGDLSRRGPSGRSRVSSGSAWARSSSPPAPPRRSCRW